MPNINIDDAYILNETGAQVDKVAGLFTKDEDTTSGEKAFAQLNIGAAGSNRNLLDNPFFTVNQRMVSGSLPNNAYGLDRWKYLSAGSSTFPTLNTDGTITFTLGGFYFYQPCETALFDYLTGKTVTYSAIIDGEIYSATFTFPSTGATNFSLGTQSLFARVNTTSKEISFHNYGGSGTINLSALKLELGSVSTLANDAPPDYGTELLKCQRYFTRWYSTAGSSAIGLALAVGTTNANFALLSNLRAEGSATISFTGLVLSDGTDKTVTNVSVAGAGDGKSMRLLVTSSGLTAYRPYVLQITAGGYLDVSKDL